MRMIVFRLCVCIMAKPLSSSAPTEPDMPALKEGDCQCLGQECASGEFLSRPGAFLTLFPQTTVSGIVEVAAVPSAEFTRRGRAVVNTVWPLCGVRRVEGPA